MKAMQKNEIEKEAVPFNMAMLFYLGLNKILETKDQVAAMGNFPAWHRALKALYRRTKFKFNKDEREKIDNLFKKVEPNFDVALSRSERLNGQLIAANHSVAEPILEDIDTELWDILHAYSMIFPKIQGYGSLDDIDKRFGFEDPEGRKKREGESENE